MPVEIAQRKPGSFSDGFVARNEKRDRKWRESLTRAKENVIFHFESIGQIVPQYARLLRAIHTSTFDAENANLEKVKTALALRQTLHEQGISERLTANIGSGTDWQFPVALGARNITMIDPAYNGKYLTDELLHSVRQFDPRAIVDIGNRHQIIFEIDVGNGKEKVALHLEPSDIEHQPSQRPFGLTVECAGPSKNSNRSHLPIHPHLVSSLNIDSLILSLDYPHEVLFDDDLGLQDIGIGKYHLYKVSDWAMMLAASKRIEKPLDSSTVALRRIHKRHEKNL